MRSQTGHRLRPPLRVNIRPLPNSPLLRVCYESTKYGSVRFQIRNERGSVLYDDVRPVYGQHLKQILITMGGMIIGEELIKVIWGAEQRPLALPEALRGSLLIGDAAIGRYRLLAVAVGALVLVLMLYALNRTKIGLLVRAGVQDREMVEALGYRIRRLFVGVFVVGSALAGLGGVLWGLFQQNVIPQLGAQVNVLIFIVIIIGGLGSTLGCFVGALLVGLLANYVGFVAPVATAFSSIALMVAILLWRPQGLYPVANR